MNSTLTDWFPGTVKPFHPGFYEREYSALEAAELICLRDYWTGAVWLWANPSDTARTVIRRHPVSMYQNRRWRGLAAPYVAPSPTPPEPSCFWFVLRNVDGDRVLNYPLCETGAQAEMPPEHLAMPDVEWPEPLPPVFRPDRERVDAHGWRASMPLPTLVWSAGCAPPVLAHDKPEPLEAAFHAMVARHDRNAATRRRMLAAAALVVFVLTLYAVALHHVYA
jgi:hypothetical protein